MKKLLLMLVALLTFTGVYSQTITLSFTGRGRGGTVTEEIYQQIDSLLVQNFTRHWERMIYYPDTVVIMDVLDVPLIEVKHEGVEQNVPNPFDCVTDVELNLSHDDAVSISIVDVNGREYLHYSGKLSAGAHVFEVTLSKPQAYMLTAVTGDSKYTIKMVNLGSCGKDEIALKSSSNVGVRAKSLIGEHFEYGDQMEYFAYTTYNGIVFNGSEYRASQTGSENVVIHFNIPYCTRTINVDYEHGCESFTWINGVTYYETDHNAARADLISAGGCDSIVLLDITIDHPVQVEEYINACQPIQWNGQNCTTAGTYVANLQTPGGCDSIVTLHLSRQNHISNDIYVSDCDSYTWNGETYEETGVYNQSFVTQYGCDSTVHLHYTNMSDHSIDVVNACDSYTWLNGQTYYSDNNTDTVHLRNIYGCDSIVTLNLTMSHSHYSNLNVTACRQFNYHGQIYTQSNTYTQTLTTVNGCDSIVTLNLTITSSVEDDIYESGCESFTFDGHTYTQSDDYDIHYTTPVGCDSIIHLHLTIVHHTSSVQNVTACDSYTWLGQEYTTSGTYYGTIMNSQGCDSVMTLNLTINHSVSTEKTINACHSYNLDGETITVSGEYERTYTAVNGCDSTVTYHINILDDVATEFTQYACGSFTWEGTTYTQTDDYVKHFTSFVGCDSTVTMHLYIGEANYDITDVQVACDSYEWEGDVYTISGPYTKTLQNRYGCDSVVNLQLTIYQSYNVTDELTVCDSYEWEGDTYISSGTYTKTLHSVHGCDSVVTLTLTVNYGAETELYDTTCGDYVWDGRTYSASGSFPYTYQTANGCDSVVTLHLVYHELVTDSRDGNTYCTMEYGDQVWMTENMRYLPEINDTRSSSEPRYYVYGYAGRNYQEALHNSNYNTYGTLYNYTSAQTACPEGWHLPSREEWVELVSYLRSNNDYICGGDSTYIAKSMASTTLWNDESTHSCNVGYEPSQNNTSKFNGLPGGRLSSTATTIQATHSKEIGNEANWWSSTPTSTGAIRFSLSNNSALTSIADKASHWGMSVRCVKDSPNGNK
ncbi:MAG: hypothetical protein J5709_05995 [Bacteroidales bacterium]|nr:hypothetical protein [Bacteroidales bacterium]